MKGFPLRISIELHKQLRLLAFNSNKSMNQLIGEILTSFLRDKKGA